MSEAFTDANVLALELAAARAWPASNSVDVAGWRVRLSGGGTRRANSVLSLRFSGTDLETAISSVEAHYRAQKTRSYFQVSSVSAPENLDATLEARGYTYEEPCLLMAKRLGPSAMPADVVVTDKATPAWLSIYTETLDAARRDAAPSVLDAVPDQRAFLLVMRQGKPLASALAVLSPDRIVLVECVATRVQARRSGGAQIVMDALEAWATQQGAHTSALQVVAGNTPARTLYERRAYAEVGRYHYRWRDVG